MALTPLVTKQSVVQLNESDYDITIHVVVKDDTEDVLLEKDYSKRYYDQTTIGDIKTALQDQIKADWDKYVNEQDIFTNAAFDTMCSNIQSALNTYINS